MTVYYDTLPLDYLEVTNPPSAVIRNITTADSIVLTISTSSSGDGGNWTRVLSSVTGCTLTPTTGANGTVTTITPSAGATSYAVIFRTSAEAGFWYGRISGNISSGNPDTTPDQFTFTDQTNVPLSSVRTSNTITVSGIDTATNISITGGEYSLNGGATWTSSSGTGNIANGQTVIVRHTSSASYSTATNTTLTIGGVSDTFTSTTLAFVSDTTPDQFTFTDQTSVPLSSVRTSNTITISGINAATNISITGGEYSLNGGTSWSSTSGTGTISNGQQIIVRHTSSGSYSTATNTTLTVGGVSDTFTSTTLAAPAPDTTPDQFTFTDQTNVPVSSVRTSNTITISGINAATNISITGGEYSLNGGSTWTSSTGTGTISNGQQIIVRHTSSASYNTAVNTVLTVGGVSDTFTSTTAAAAAPTYSASNLSINEGASGSVTVTTTNVTNGTTLYWTVNATTADVPTLSGSFTINSNSGSFTISAIADLITEGVETYTISVRTGSISGPIVAESTLTINDTSVPTGGQYGLQVFNSSGALILDISSRLPRFVMSGLTSTIASGASTNITVTDMQNTDNWLVFAIDSDVNRTSFIAYTITKNNGFFTITNSMAETTASFYYWVFRS